MKQFPLNWQFGLASSDYMYGIQGSALLQCWNKHRRQCCYRHFLKNYSRMWSAAFLQFITQRVYRLEIANFLSTLSNYFRPSFVIFTLPCCPPPVLSVSHYPSPLPSLFTYLLVQCVTGGGGLRQIKSCRKVPFQVTFQMTKFCIAFCESYLSMTPPLRHQLTLWKWLPSFLLSSYFFSMCGTHCSSVEAFALLAT